MYYQLPEFLDSTVIYTLSIHRPASIRIHLPLVKRSIYTLLLRATITNDSEGVSHRSLQTTILVTTSFIVIFIIRQSTGGRKVREIVEPSMRTLYQDGRQRVFSRRRCRLDQSSSSAGAT